MLVSIRAYRATQHTLQQCDKSQDIDAREDVAGTVPKIWSSCTHFMMHKFKPAEFHAATCCGVKILSPKTRNLFIKSSQIRGLASALCPCFTTHKLKPAEFNATCCRDKFCPHNRFFNTTQCLPERGGGGTWLHILSLLHDTQIQTS